MDCIDLFASESVKGFYPVFGVNASTIRPFSIIFRYVWYRKTSFCGYPGALHGAYVAHFLSISQIVKLSNHILSSFLSVKSMYND